MGYYRIDYMRSNNLTLLPDEVINIFVSVGDSSPTHTISFLSTGELSSGDEVTFASVGAQYKDVGLLFTENCGEGEV